MKIDPNAPACSEMKYRYRLDGSVESCVPVSGLTIRAEIAARVLAGFAASNSSGSCKEFANLAVSMADALIAELNREAV